MRIELAEVSTRITVDGRSWWVISSLTCLVLEWVVRHAVRRRGHFHQRRSNVPLCSSLFFVSDENYRNDEVFVSHRRENPTGHQPPPLPGPMTMPFDHQRLRRSDLDCHC